MPVYINETKFAIITNNRIIFGWGLNSTHSIFVFSTFWYFPDFFKLFVIFLSNLA